MKKLFVILLILTSNTYAITDAERDYCLQQSYDAQQIAVNKLNGISKEQILNFINNLPDEAVPEGYKNSNRLNVMEVYDKFDFKLPEEAQQQSLIQCLNWHKERDEEIF